MRPVSGVAWICFALAACAPEVDPCEEPSFSEEGATFLVSRISFGEMPGLGAAPGFDLDGVTSLGGGRNCVDESRDQLLAPDGDLDGIDNNVALAVPILENLVGDLAIEGDPLGLDAAVARGHILLVLEVVPRVGGGDPTLRVHRAAPADGSLELDASGRPAAGQRFRGELVARGLLVRDPARAPLTRRSVAVLVPFAATVSDPSPAPPFDLAQLTHVGLNQCPGSGPRGRIGGTWTPDDIATWVRRLGHEELASNAAEAVRWVTDLDPDPRDPTQCRRVSFGLALDLVPAELVVD